MGYDDPTVADDVEAAYDADLALDLYLAKRLKWARRGLVGGRLLLVATYLACYALLIVAFVNFAHVVAKFVEWIWGWWG